MKKEIKSEMNIDLKKIKRMIKFLKEKRNAVKNDPRYMHKVFMNKQNQ